MSCNRCGSNNLWDDNLWWGCNDCGYAAGPDGGTMLFAKDKPGLARNLRDIPGSSAFDNMPRVVRTAVNTERDEGEHPCKWKTHCDCNGHCRY